MSDMQLSLLSGRLSVASCKLRGSSVVGRNKELSDFFEEIFFIMADHVGDRAGQQYGHYSLLRLLGKGGFAEVYLGQHIYLNTQAAIKVLHTQLTRDEQDNFLNEARIIARLVHPNIVRVLDFGMQGEQPFLVMDYAPNGSLRDRHPRGTPLPLTTAVSYIKQAAAALHYAHHEKLVHRDVKPENMLVGRNGEILLSDFGISVVSQSSQSQHTQEVVGSIPYMAPEQLQGKPRPATDQYALAIIAYEWLTGERPFQGGFTEMYAQHVFTPPPPLHTKNPNIPPEVEQVVLIGLAKDPHQRFADIQAFARALEQAGSGGQAIAVPLQHNAAAKTDPHNTATEADPYHAAAKTDPHNAPTEANSPQLEKASFHAQTTLNEPPIASISDNVTAGATTNQPPFLPPQGQASPSLPTVPTPQGQAGYPQTQQISPEEQKLVKRRLPRRAVLGGLIGLAAVAVAGGISWSNVTHP
ncbi:MAG: protein kinase, partial [Ktedonobacteraceae bacterium]|nr:protein kinase [Ktedonobacteraceae bacterium]